MKLPFKALLVGLVLLTVFSWFGLAHERLDILSHFRLHFALAGILMTILLSITRSWHWASAAILLTGINFWTSIGYHHTNTAVASPVSDQVLKIMSLNTLYISEK